MTAIDKPSDKKPQDVVLDLSALTPDEITEIDTGVTSGADSSDWDPIDVDEDKSDECSGAGSQSAASKSSPTACGVRQQ